MKTIIAIFALFTIVSAHATSEFSLTCTNVDGTVKWVEGTHGKFIHFTAPETLTLDLRLAEIKVLEQVALDTKVENMCGYYHSVEDYAAKVEISPVANSPRHFNVVETSVICRKEIKTTFLCRK